MDGGVLMQCFRKNLVCLETAFLALRGAADDRPSIFNYHSPDNICCTRKHQPYDEYSVSRQHLHYFNSTCSLFQLI